MSEQEELKPGPELDAKLCHLLEPRPPDAFPWEKPESDIPLEESHKGFWERGDFYMCMGKRPEWKPIPVSTDWAAMGKVIDELLGRGMYMHFSWLAPESGSNMKHIVALAAVKALEKKREAI